MASIPAALARVKEDYAHLISAPVIEDLCQQARHPWRQRVLDPVTTVQLFVLQILHGNLAINHLRRVSRLFFSDSAYCQARSRLPLAVLTGLLCWVAAHTAPLQIAAALGPIASTWHGHRLLLEDGSSASMPDSLELQGHYGRPTGQAPGCGFPVAHLLFLMDYATGMVLDVLDSPLRTNDLKNAKDLLGRPAPGDLILADRAFCSFAHMALIVRENLQAVFRLHQGRIVSFKARRCGAAGGKNNKSRKGQPRSKQIARLRAPRGMLDQIVLWEKPADRPPWMSPADFDALPATLEIRELRYRVRHPGFRTHEVTLATTLTDPRKYPAAELAELYFRRWQVEQNLRSLKTSMKMDVLRCRSVDGVRKELTVYAIAYNLVCLVMVEAARRQQVDVHRVSFVDALRWLAQARDEPLPDLVVNPFRPGRVQPRLVKRRPKQYSLLTRPRNDVIAQLIAGAKQP